MIKIDSTTEKIKTRDVWGQGIITGHRVQSCFSKTFSVSLSF